MAAYKKATGHRANFISVGGYDGMHLIYAALKATNGNTDADAIIGAMKGMKLESPARADLDRTANPRHRAEHLYPQSRDGERQTSGYRVQDFSGRRGPTRRKTAARIGCSRRHCEPTGPAQSGRPDDELREAIQLHRQRTKILRRVAPRNDNEGTNACAA